MAKSYSNFNKKSNVLFIIDSMLKAFLSVNSKILLIGLMLVTFDSGINQIRNSFAASNVDPQNESVLFGKVGASSIDCTDLNIRKPPRFGKREAYIDKYQTTTNCIDRRRRLIRVKDTTKTRNYLFPKLSALADDGGEMGKWDDGMETTMALLQINNQLQYPMNNAIASDRRTNKLFELLNRHLMNRNVQQQQQQQQWADQPNSDGNNV